MTRPSTPQTQRARKRFAHAPATTEARSVPQAAVEMPAAPAAGMTAKTLTIAATVVAAAVTTTSATTFPASSRQRRGSAATRRRTRPLL